MSKRELERIKKEATLLVEGRSSDPGKFVEIYPRLSEKEKEELFTSLIPFGPDERKILELADRLKNPKETSKEGIIKSLRKTLASPREKLFKILAKTRGGLKTLLDMRSDLIRLSRRNRKLSIIEDELKELFEEWFQEGFLYLSEITLDTSYRVLHFVKEHEMVHPTTSIEEMAKRLEKDKLCFGLYHVLLPDEPIVFIEVALKDHIPSSIDEIVEEDGDKRKNTAVFYSINNTKKGLSGLGLAKILIAKVMDEIKKKYPSIKTFCTLSPVPSLKERYLKPLLLDKKETFLMKPKDVERLFSEKAKEFLVKKTGVSDFLKALWIILEDPSWVEDEELRRILKKPLTEIVYFYLSKERDEKGRPLDPVANFHISNGALLRKKYVRFLGNTHDYGIRESATFMVNYIYELSWFSELKSAISRLPFRAHHRTEGTTR